MTIGVISAMAKEHSQLTALLNNGLTENHRGYSFDIGSVGDNTLVLMQSGMGKVNAALGAAALIDLYAPDCIVSTGCAGGVAGMSVMDVVVSSATAYHDVSIPGCEPGQMQGLPARFRCDEQLVEIATSLHADSRIMAGLICTGDQFVTTAQQRDAIVASWPDVKAVDMESAAIAHTCFLRQVPFVSFRVISDSPGADNHIDQYFNFWDSVADHSFEVTRLFLTAMPAQLAVLPFAG